MYRGETIAVVVPAHDEEGFVGEVITSVPAFVDRIYAVDDASTDDTWAEIQAAARRVAERDGDDTGAFDRRVVPIRHEENRGVGGAIKTGYLRAREDRIDVTAVMGGDGQMRPDDLEGLVEPVATGRADYAKGNRLAGEDYHDDMPRFRYVGNRILTLLTKIASGYWGVEDPQNGYTAISLDALEAVAVEDMYEFYGYCNDLLVKLNVAGLRVVDVPIEAAYADEESGIEYSSYVPRVSSMLARNAAWRCWQSYVVREHHPLALFAGLGALAGWVGVRRLVDRLRGDGDADPWDALAIALATLAAALALDREHDAHLAEQVEDEAEGGDERVHVPDAETTATNGAATAPTGADRNGDGDGSVRIGTKE